MSKIEKLAAEIFDLVEFDQGKGFISDGLDALKTERELFEIVRGHLRASERAARKIRGWLKKYGQAGKG